MDENYSQYNPINSGFIDANDDPSKASAPALARDSQALERVRGYAEGLTKPTTAPLDIIDQSALQERLRIARELLALLTPQT